MHGHHPDEPTFCVLDGEGLSLGTLSKPKSWNIINELMAKFDEEHSASVLAANL